MKKLGPWITAFVIVSLGIAVALAVFDVRAAHPDQKVKYEVELGVQVLTPDGTTPQQLSIPNYTKHAEFAVVTGPCYVRWNGSVPSSATGFPWFTNHMRKESNDGLKLTGFRALGPCELRVIYFGDRRDQ